MADILKTFHPKALAGLSETDKAELQNLTPAQVSQLAKEYPNVKHGVAYLVLADKNVKDPTKQLYPVSSWQNLDDLYKIGQTNYVPFASKEDFKRPSSGTAPTGSVQDLTEEELQKEKGLKRKTNTKAQEAQNLGAGEEGEGEDFNDLADEAQENEGKPRTPRKTAAKKTAGRKKSS